MRVSNPSKMLASWLTLLCLLLAMPAAADWYRDHQDIMGTRISVELWSEDESNARNAIAAVMAEMRRIDQALSTYIDSSELSRVNAAAAKAPLPISDELYSLIEKSLYYSRLSEGAFDISFASLGRFYDYRQGQQPDQQQLQALLQAINYRHIELDAERRSLYFHHPELKIDLGGIAKGYAVDNGIEILKREGIGAAIVSAGGDSRILGDRGGRPWVMGIRHPRREGEHAVTIPLRDTALSTSGDYERYFIEEDERIHHIINPATGRSAGELQSVSVLAPLAIDSDALSTTVFVLGIEKGLALINRLPGIDAIIIDKAGKLHYSADLLRASESAE